ncbi:9929_t:CDS:2 [Ambispora gerdemannii]|uniref:9929_t:CDS:1 n=1 Tax=Ambispora gerdemannii TaxID=144530 RepID=A0A9N8ZZT1_9GLOM|nr:9929_t:CDS:2 [Ambispora gerdemannii]
MSDDDETYDVEAILDRRTKKEWSRGIRNKVVKVVSTPILQFSIDSHNYDVDMDPSPFTEAKNEFF